MSASARLGELGIALPQVVAPLASYVPAVRTGNLVYTAGQLPMEDGKLARTGKVGAEVSPEDAKAMARICALNALAAVDSLVGIDAVTRVVKVVGFVASAPGFQRPARRRQRGLRPARRGVRRRRRARAFGGRGIRATAGCAGGSRADRGGRLDGRDRDC